MNYFNCIVSSGYPKWELPILPHHKIMVIYPYSCLVVITQLFSWIIFINDCIWLSTGSHIYFFWWSYMLYKKLGITRILLFSQWNGKLPLPRWKQGNYPVITIYYWEVLHSPILCLEKISELFSNSQSGWISIVLEQTIKFIYLKATYILMLQIILYSQLPYPSLSEDPAYANFSETFTYITGLYQLVLALQL